MRTEKIKFVAGLFLKFADYLPEFFQRNMPVSYETALSITEDLMQMALRGIEKKRSETNGNEESKYGNG